MRIISLVTLAAIATASVAQANSLHSVDRDSSGGISFAEFERVYGPERGKINFSYIDKNNDQMIDWVEFNSELND